MNPFHFRSQTLINSIYTVLLLVGYLISSIFGMAQVQAQDSKWNHSLDLRGFLTIPSNQHAVYFTSQISTGMGAFYNVEYHSRFGLFRTGIGIEQVSASFRNDLKVSSPLTAKWEVRQTYTALQIPILWGTDLPGSERWAFRIGPVFQALNWSSITISSSSEGPPAVAGITSSPVTDFPGWQFGLELTGLVQYRLTDRLDINAFWAWSTSSIRGTDFTFVAISNGQEAPEITEKFDYTWLRWGLSLSYKLFPERQ